MSGGLDDDRAEFGLLFVDGFREQRPGSAIALLGAALYGWLFRWNSVADPRQSSQPALAEAVAFNARAEDGQPAHLTLSVPLHLNTGERDASWLLAESSWADLFASPRFLGVARWIWKVSTCLLVLQFVIPMRRHWINAGLRRGSWPQAIADRFLAGVYVLLMGAAAMLSVLFSLVLLGLALAAYLPIPRIDEAVRWLIVTISAMLGDSYMLAHCPVQFATMRTKVASDLEWLRQRCDRVAVVAHSQGAAIAHRVLKDAGCQRDGVTGFITLGQGISKLDLLQRMDWDPDVHRAAWQSRLLVTAGMASAGLPALGLVAARWLDAAPLTALTSLPVILLLIAVGFICVALGIREAMRAVCGLLAEDLSLPDAGYIWSDYYASADPVSNGPLPQPGKGLLPDPCRQVFNGGSVVFDHNGYLRNQDEVLPHLLNDLVRAAYSQHPGSKEGPGLVCDEDIVKASFRRQRLVRWLVTARVVAAGSFAALWWANPGSILRRPFDQLMRLLPPHAQMGNGAARFVAALLLAAALYFLAVIVWRIRISRSAQIFFRAAAPVSTTSAPFLEAAASHAAVGDMPSGIA